MHKIRWQLVITFLLLHFAVLLVGNGAGLLINAERVRNDTEALIHEQRIIALELAKKTDLPAEEIVGTLASAGFEMYIVPIPESLTPQQLGQLMEGGVVYEGGVGRLKMYFMLREEVVLCEFQIIQSQVFIATVRTFLSNLLVSLLILGAITLVSKRMVRPIVELTQATREVARGNFDVRVETKPSRISLLAQSDELTELNENFNHMTDELKGVEYLRRDFTSNVSHEIKTPLATISGYARLLQHEGVAEADRQEYSQAIYTEATRLAGLSDNLLKLSRLESQSMPPSAQPFRLDEQIRCSITTVLPQLEEKGLSIDLDIEETNIESDEDLLSQVWTNLLTNAIKFTPSGGEIRVAIKPLSRDVAVTVSDTGIGMSAETVARAYEKFYQADASRRTGGSGLGLSLVKRIVGLLGGRIELTSTPGMGSTFCITLPKRLSASPGI